jgi:hypothetical protein
LRSIRFEKWSTPVLGTRDTYVAATDAGTVRGTALTDIYIMIFFGVALIIGIYFTWILLRNEMAGRPKPGLDLYDFGFGTSPPRPPNRVTRYKTPTR